jgi:hypothetical protein
MNYIKLLTAEARLKAERKHGGNMAGNADPDQRRRLKIQRIGLAFSPR